MLTWQQRSCTRYGCSCILSAAQWYWFLVRQRRVSLASSLLSLAYLAPAHALASHATTGVMICWYAVELLELRYFVLPFLLYTLHSPAFAMAVQRGSLRLPLVCNILVNAGTLGLFLFRPFTWPDGSVARFMW